MEYPVIDLSQWQQIGEGGNGKTYANPDRPEDILKVNNDRLNNFEFVKHEYDVTKAVEAMGISVPAMREIVRVGNGFATISQRIHNKKSLSRICKDEPERTAEIARLLAQKGKELFATPCNNDFFPSRKEQALWAIEHANYVSKKNRKLIRAFIETIPEANTCVHGDFQTGNLIKSGDSFYWIDLDRFAHGDPMFDIGHLFLICEIYAPMKRVQDIFHMTLEQFHALWDAFAKEYTGQEDHADFDKFAGKFACVDIVVRARFIMPTFMESLFYRMQVKKLVKGYFNQD